MQATDTPAAAVTVPSLRRMKADMRRITMLTAYDASFARLMDAAGVDTVLVGDSLGMVAQGHASTLRVTLDDMVYHTACVARGLRRALLVADLPFLGYATRERALDGAQRLLGEAGASMVKLEGAGPSLDIVQCLSERDVPVCGHIGLTPQSVLKLGGYRVQGRDSAVAAKLRADAVALQDAGAALLVLECVPHQLATEITQLLDIPTIGIGAGSGCDGQVLVMHDLLGVGHGSRRPRFVKDFLAQGGSVEGAFRAYVDEVRSGAFPTLEHSYE